VFPSDFAATLVGMVRFRNILVHVYARVDAAKVHASLQDSLGDFTLFAGLVTDFLSAQAAP
jgi:uncharacterized protein YutE (UPF0331/DUF86 family)